MLQLQRLDHLVLTVTDVETTCQFYTSVLGCEIVRFRSADGENRYAIRIGDSPQKINLHPTEHPFQPAAQHPQPGSGDLCFMTSVPLGDVVRHFDNLSIPIVLGPIQRTGTLGPILSVYIRDPDGNLIEVANAIETDSEHANSG